MKDEYVMKILPSFPSLVLLDPIYIFTKGKYSEGNCLSYQHTYRTDQGKRVGAQAEHPVRAREEDSWPQCSKLVVAKGDLIKAPSLSSSVKRRVYTGVIIKYSLPGFPVRRCATQRRQHKVLGSSLSLPACQGPHSLL